MLKIDLDSFPVDKVIEIYRNAKKNNFPNKNNVYINDIDLTQDFSGLNKKEEIVDCLLGNHDFRVQMSFDLATRTILDKDYKIPRNCLTFMKHSGNGDIRFKIYKKFVQSLERKPFCQKSCGSHISDYISNPKTILEKAIMEAKVLGF